MVSGRSRSKVRLIKGQRNTSKSYGGNFMKIFVQVYTRLRNSLLKGQDQLNLWRPGGSFMVQKMTKTFHIAVF